MKEIKNIKYNTYKNIDKDQICIINNETGEVYPSNAMTALRDFERISKGKKNFSLIFPANENSNIR